jgi:hypothetical protein
VIHRYPVGHPLGYLLEGRWGQGSLIICSLGLDQSYPEARHLLSQICAYGVSENMQPDMELSAESMRELVRGTALP